MEHQTVLSSNRWMCRHRRPCRRSFLCTIVLVLSGLNNKRKVSKYKLKCLTKPPARTYLVLVASSWLHCFESSLLAVSRSLSLLAVSRSSSSSSLLSIFFVHSCSGAKWLK
jgi:hypothetical protein